ncbi:MAG: hypothetical protein IJU43_05845 [Lachnospiraceae bacterium]|nr:hypothetical protein [Lachnospiraceae bacterium]
MTKDLENLEKTSDGIRTGSGSYLVNKKHIVVGKPSKTCVIDMQEVGSEAAKGMSGRNIAIYGMAAVVDSEDNPSIVHLAENATLINEGIIEIYLNEMVEAYKDQLKENKDDQSKLYNFIRCYAMGAGKNSLLINEGIIRLHIDQEDEDAPVYVLTMSGGEKSTVINNGTIELTGKGTFSSQLRAMTVHANDPTIINNGLIKIDVAESSTVRVLATTKLGGSISNFGEIDVTSSGKIMTIGRMADTHVLNAGKMNIDFKAHFVEQKVSFLYQSDPLACAIYEHCPPGLKITHIPPVVNTGEINILLEGSEASTDRAVAFGIYTEMIPGGEHTQVHRYENTGTIKLSVSGPYKLVTAELGCNYQCPKDLPYDIKIGTWNTDARDFAKTKDLILCKSGRVDLSEAVFVINGGDGDYKAEDLVAQTDDGETFSISGTETMKIEKK